METYRLNSKLNDNDKEYLITTSNDISMGTISSEIYIDGFLADYIKFPHPERIKAEEVLSLVKTTHGEKKKEIETLLSVYHEVINSGIAEKMYALGLAFFYKRFYLESRQLFYNATSIKENYYEACYYLSKTELALGNIQKAVEFAQIAVNQRPSYADYRNNLGEAFMAGKMYKKASLEFERAININLYYSDAYFNYGLVLLLNALNNSNRELFSNFLSKSFDYFTKASLIYPGYKIASFERGLKALKNKDLKRAYELFRNVYENKNEHYRRKYASYYMKSALLPQNITEQAVWDRIYFLKEEINNNPTYVDLYAELARCYLEQGKIFWEKGIAQYKKTLDVNPDLVRLKSYIENAEDVLKTIDMVMSEVNEQGY